MAYPGRSLATELSDDFVAAPPNAKPTSVVCVKAEPDVPFNFEKVRKSRCVTCVHEPPPEPSAWNRQRSWLGGEPSEVIPPQVYRLVVEGSVQCICLLRSGAVFHIARSGTVSAVQASVKSIDHVVFTTRLVSSVDGW